MYNIKNLVTIVKHPKLLWSYLHGSSRTDLQREHLKIGLDQISKISKPLIQYDLFTFFINAIDLCNGLSAFKMQFLYLLCQQNKPNIIVETGVHSGYSSTFILGALQDYDGHLYSIDLPNVTYQVENGKFHSDIIPQGFIPGYIIPDELRINWSLTLGDSKNVLPKLLEKLEKIDMFLHDSMHTYDLMTFEFETIWPRLRKGGLLVCDDAEWNHAFADFCEKKSVDYVIYRGIGLTKK